VYNALISTAFGVAIKDINFSFKVVHRRVWSRSTEGAGSSSTPSWW